MTLLEKAQEEKRDSFGCTRLDYELRLRGLRYGIALQYVAILFFLAAAISTLLAAVWMPCLFLSVLFILIGCILTFLGVCQAMREICTKSRVILDEDEIS